MDKLWYKLWLYWDADCVQKMTAKEFEKIRSKHGAVMLYDSKGVKTNAGGIAFAFPTKEAMEDFCEELKGCARFEYFDEVCYSD